MPNYEYRCGNCDYLLELSQNIDAQNTYMCPQCNELMYRIISKNSFILKGQGWSKDNYSKKG